jgi:uncharacterized protein YjdB
MLDRSSRDVTAECTYSSTDEASATVTASGVVTAVAAGRSLIRIVHSSGREASRPPEVWVGKPIDIGLTPAASRIAVGTSVDMRALAIYDNGRSQEVTDEVSWSSTDPAVASAPDSAGSRVRVHGRAAGRAAVAALHPPTGVRSRSPAQIEVFLQAASDGASVAVK